MPDNTLFKKALKFVLKWEGGFSHHPNDLGGATNKGITQSTYNIYLHKKGLAAKSVKFISQVEVEDIYLVKYWNLAGCEGIKSQKLSVLVFDTAVNMGISRAKRLLINSNWDINKFISLRESLYRRFASVKGQNVFLQGWLNRLNDLKNTINTLNY